MKPPEEALKDLVRQWIAKADDDFQLAGKLLEEREFLSAAGFHSQQSTEKYLKAFLVAHQIDFRKTHNIGELLDMVEKIDSELSRFLDKAIILNPYGVDVRYPGDIPDVNLEDATEAVEIARKVRITILKLIAPGD